MFLSQYLPLYDGEIFFFVFLAGHEVLADMRFWPRKPTISFLSNLRSPRGPIRYALSMPRLLHRLTVLIWTLSVLAASLAVRNLSSSLTSTMHYFPSQNALNYSYPNFSLSNYKKQYQNVLCCTSQIVLHGKVLIG